MPVFQLHVVRIYFKQWKEGKNILQFWGFLVCFCMNLQVMLSGWFVAFVLLADTQWEIIIFQESLASFLVI